MIVRLLACAVSIACAAPTSAQTNPPPLEMPAGKPVLHPHSGVTLPARLSGLERTGAREYAAPQLDVLFTYKDQDGEEELSVYIYRVTTGSPSVWFEQAVRPISDRPAFRRMTDVDLPLGFALPGQRLATGMRAAWAVSDSQVKSTVLALVPIGDWLVKFRHSSTTLDAATLTRRLDAMIARIGWPAAVVNAPAPERIAACTTPLKLDGASKPVSQARAPAPLGELLLGVPAEADRKIPDWCMDRTVGSPLPIYRPAGTDDRYLAGLSDSGHAAWVRPAASGSAGNDRKSRWAVSIVLAGTTINYDDRDRLPPPAELDAILEGRETSRIKTWGQREIRIPPSQTK